jgi:hypothetical protein
MNFVPECHAGNAFAPQLPLLSPVAPFSEKRHRPRPYEAAHENAQRHDNFLVTVGCSITG